MWSPTLVWLQPKKDLEKARGRIGAGEWVYGVPQGTEHSKVKLVTECRKRPLRDCNLKWMGGLRWAYIVAGLGRVKLSEIVDKTVNPL